MQSADRGRRARDARQRGIVSLLADMAGPTATPNVHDAFGPTAHRHLELAAIAGRLLVQGVLPERVPGQMLDLERIKQAATEWIDSGIVESAFEETCRVALRRIAALLAESEGAGDAARLRLALLAPLAAPIETLLVMSQLSQSLVELMAKSKTAARSSAAAAHQWMRSHPDSQPG